MRQAGFSRGVNDKRAGRPFDTEIVDDEDTDESWAYERGRLWASLAPVNLPLFIGRKLNPKAVQLYSAASQRKLIL